MSDNYPQKITQSSQALHDLSKNVLSYPEIDRILGVLSNRHRRLILLSLKHGRAETKADVMIRGGSEQEAVERQLIHNHLPKLAEAGYINWSRGTGEISKGPQFEEIEPLLELIEAHADELPPDWP